MDTQGSIMAQLIMQRTLKLALIGFALVWIFQFSLYLITPYQSLTGYNFSIIYGIAFMLISAATALFLNSTLSSHFLTSRDNPHTSDFFKSTKLLNWTLLISVFGLLLHLYDKVILRQYDYSICIGVARQAWLNRATTGISSWQSAAGHIFSHMPFFTVLLIAAQQSRLSKLMFYLMLTLSTVVVFVYAVSLGGRSTIFLYAITVASAFLLTYVMEGRMKKSTIFNVLVPIVLMTVLYSASLFAIRISCYGQDMNTNDYIAGYFDELGIKSGTGDLSDEEMQLIKKRYPVHQVTAQLNKLVASVRHQTILESLADISTYKALKSAASMMLIYINNGSWNYEQAMTDETREGTAFLTFFYGWTHKLGLKKRVDTSVNRSYGKGMISLPGAVWYDFGWYGFIIFAMALGAFIWFTALQLSKGGVLFITGVLCFQWLAMVLLMSPLTFAMNLMSFPFIIFCTALGIFALLIENRVSSDSNDHELVLNRNL